MMIRSAVAVRLPVNFVESCSAILCAPVLVAVARSLFSLEVCHYAIVYGSASSRMVEGQLRVYLEVYLCSAYLGSLGGRRLLLVAFLPRI
jgi:hypothetical protein